MSVSFASPFDGGSPICDLGDRVVERFEPGPTLDPQPVTPTGQPAETVGGPHPPRLSNPCRPSCRLGSTPVRGPSHSISGCERWSTRIVLWYIPQPAGRRPFGRSAVRACGKVSYEERAIGFEPTTSSLGSWHSTTELRPQL